MSANDDEGRAVAFVPGFLNCLIEGCEVVHIRDTLHVPAIRRKSLRDIVAARQICAAFDRDVIVVEESDEPAEVLVSRERGGFVRETLHQIAITGDEPREVVDDRVPVAIELCREVFLGDRHSDRVRDTLAKRSRGSFHARRMPHFGMARRLALPLAKLLDILERDVVAAQEKRRVEQHRCVSCREHNTIPSRPERISRVMPYVVVVERISERGERHRRAGMSRLGLLDRIHREGANRVDGEQLQIGTGELGQVGRPQGKGAATG
jgi:hypothetical protein